MSRWGTPLALGKGIIMSSRGDIEHHNLLVCRCGLTDLLVDSRDAATRVAAIAEHLGLPDDLARMVYLAWLVWRAPHLLPSGADKPHSKSRQTSAPTMCPMSPAPTDPPAVPDVRLSQRELEVARLVAYGKTNHAIADELGIGERTAETHVSHILEKLGFATRAQIAAWVVGQGHVVSP